MPFNFIMRKNTLKTLLALLPLSAMAQVPQGYWQQEVDYSIQIKLNTKNHQFTGTEQLKYFNHSPDTINEVFFHLYFNAFQPNSMMDVRSRNLPDPDGRVKDRISKLKGDEIGIQKVKTFKMNGKEAFTQSEETLLKVLLPEALLPGDTAIFDLEFEGQVPVQIRRSGRNNEEGIDYTMTQWYPKIAAYDNMGWHADPYVAREFYAPFGKFEVQIELPSDYKVAATGSLQDFDSYWAEGELEDGVQFLNLKPWKPDVRTWTFKAENVHDFAWAADPEYIHSTVPMDSSLDLHFFYLEDYDKTWERLPKYTQQFFREMNKRYGRYPYPQFSAIQGGDGGMEYPMCTMLKGTGKISGLVGVTVHEGAHNWYYGILGSNELRFPWMDEGFTSFAESEVLNAISPRPVANPHANAYAAHAFLISKTEQNEALITMADRFERNRTYSINAYSRGEVFLAQLRYVIGKEAFDRGMKRFFNTWRFKHPEPWDLIRIMERESGMQLDWYYHQWVETTKTIDYGIARIEEGKGATKIYLERLGTMSMPLRIRVYLKDESVFNYYIPTLMQFGELKEEGYNTQKAWPWTHPEYEWLIPFEADQIEKVVIDEEGFMADINRTNNSYPREEGQN